MTSNLVRTRGHLPGQVPAITRLEPRVGARRSGLAYGGVSGSRVQIQRCRFRRVTESVRIRHRRANGKGGSDFKSSQTRLGFARYQHSQRQLFSFQRSAMDKLSCSFLARPSALTSRGHENPLAQILRAGSMAPAVALMVELADTLL